jgi:MFS family permease
LFLTVILAGILIRSAPEELGQIPDGTAENCWLDKIAFLSSKAVYTTQVDWTLGEALRAPALWLLIFIFSVILFVLTLLTTHQVAYLQDLNYSPLASTSALGLMLGTSIFGRIISGVLGMKFAGRYLAAVFLALMFLGVLCLIKATGIIFVYLYAIFMGIGFGGMIVLMPNMIGAYFGRANYPRISGWTMPVVTLAFAGAPLMAGFFHDATGTYMMPFGIAAALLFTCGIISLFARPPVKRG